MPNLPIESLVSQVAWILLGASLVGILAKKLRFPYAVALVLIGLIVAEADFVDVPELEPSLILFAFLPPLLFDAAFRIDARELRAVIRPVAWLAVPGVLATAGLVGVAAWLLVDVPLGVGLLFGSIVAATDPVAVIAILKNLGLPYRVQVIPEAESLVNDGMAITLYTALLGYAITGHMAATDFVEIFGREVFGGLLAGCLLGFVFSRVTATIDDHSLEMMLSTALAYGSYLTANELHASGPLACVAAGFIHGTYGRKIGMSSHTSERLDDLWEYLGFAANAVVFLLVGFTVNLDSLRDARTEVVIAIGAVVAARVVVVHSTKLLPLGTAGPGRGERLILIWAGLRGALTIALAIALPSATPHRELLITMSFGVVLFTLIVQGLSLPLVARQLDEETPQSAAGGGS